MIRVNRSQPKQLGRKLDQAQHEEESKQIARKVAQARNLSERYLQKETVLDDDMFAIMQCALELHTEFVSLGQIDHTLIQVLASDGIKITKNTTSNFIPLMKLLAPKLPSSTRGRSASILAFAEGHGVNGRDIGEFVRAKGGIVKCAVAARIAKKPHRDQQQAEKNDVKLQVLRQNAKPIAAPVLNDGLEEGIWCCLIEKKGNKLRLLSVKAETSNLRFAPLSDDEFLDFS